MPKITTPAVRTGADHRYPWVGIAEYVPEEGDVVVSYSELSTYRSCPLKHYLVYKERWTKPVDEMSALGKGTLWHLVMEAHYLNIQMCQRGLIGKDELEDRLHEEVGALLCDPITGEQSEVQELVAWMYEGYREQWGYDDQWQILAVEHKFHSRIPSVSENDHSPFVLKGKLDLVVRDRNTGYIWVVDHKSGANLPNEDDLDMADQFALYLWLLRQNNVRVVGAIHSAARTTRNAGDRPENQDPATGLPLKSNQKKQSLDQRFKRTLMSRGDKELHNIANDAWSTAANAYPEALGWDPLPLYSNPDTMPFTWRGEWRDVYLMSRKGRPIHDVLTELGFVQNYERH